MQTVILHGKSQRDFAKQLIDIAPKDAVLTIREAKRSLEQNDKLWAILSDISRAKPLGRRHTPEVWKNLMMHACGHAVQFENGIDGQPFPVGFRSSKLNKQQMSELIEFTLAFCAEHNVKLSEPEE